jgi:hypothetical protein
MEYIARIKTEGDYFEFGLFRGRTFIAAYHFAQANKLHKMKFYGFDSFQGLPQIQGVDAGGEFAGGQYAMGVERFTNLIRGRGVDLQKVKLVPGWYSESLNAQTKAGLQARKAALIFVDCDLYESTVPVLEFVTDYVQDGTVLAFDDWFGFKGHPQKGEQRAFKEWLARNPGLQAQPYRGFGTHGESFVLCRATEHGST